MTSIYRALASSTIPNAISKGEPKSQATPDSYHSTLSLCDNLTVCFHLKKHNSSAYTASLLHSHRNFGYLHGSLTPTQKFRITPRVESLTPTQKFKISPRVSYTHTEIRDTSYTHTEIRDTSPSLLHPHRNLGYPPRSLTPTQKFEISPRVSFTLTSGFSP